MRLGEFHKSFLEDFTPVVIQYMEGLETSMREDLARSFSQEEWLPVRSAACISIYRIAGIFRGVIFSWFSWSRGEPRNIYPRKTPRARAQNKRQTARPRNFFHEIAKITTFTKILPLEKYPLYGTLWTFFFFLILLLNTVESFFN